ncbi:MAG TPA: AMP-binding protein [Bacillota bacterium]|nr:AMP-binding protein [Bacillota bacterium]
MNLSTIIANNASFRPNYRAIICADDERSFTWSEFDRQVNKLGNALLRLGVKKGEFVAVYLPNCPELLFTYFALWRIGAVVLPFNILFKSVEIAFICNDSQARFLIGAATEVREWVVREIDKYPGLQQIITVGEKVEGCHDFHQLIAEEPEELQSVKCGLDEIVMMLYTSGTTGRPKGAMLSYHNLLSSGTLSLSIMHVNDRDLFFTNSPFSHISFVMSILSTFIAGASLLTVRQFNAEKTLELIGTYGVTHYFGVPTIFALMLGKFNQELHNLKSLRCVFSAGAALPVQYIDQIEQLFDVDLIEMYGATETSTTMTYNRLGHTRKGSVGQVAQGNQIIIADDAGQPLAAGEVGEVLIKGPGVFKVYWNLPQASQDAFVNGWFRTGDLGRMDKDGYLFLEARKSDLIICGGYNVYPVQVENVILTHPKITEVVVVGVKDPILNQIVKAFVVLAEGEEMTPEEFTAFCKGKMASYKVPRQVEFIPELPKSSTGKVLKRMLTSKN